eukprot:4294-Eustigmatos_ZCMA.PRE.1
MIKEDRDELNLRVMSQPELKKLAKEVADAKTDAELGRILGVGKSGYLSKDLLIKFLLENEPYYDAQAPRPRLVPEGEVLPG